MKNRKDRTFSRRRAVRKPLRKFVIFCEGRNTEPQYFEALKAHLRGTLIEIETVKGVGTPFTIAQAATKLARERGISTKSRHRIDSFEAKDEIWAVFDRDEHPKYQEAVSFCAEHSVGVGRSNPCFEVWLILHQQDFNSPVGRHTVQEKLQELCPEYSAKKGKLADCSKFIHFVEIAEERAEKQLSARDSEGFPYGAPSTTVFELTRRIRSAAKPT